MAFASITTASNNPTLLSPDDVVSVDDNGDGTSTINLAHRGPIKSTSSASAVLSALWASRRLRRRAPATVAQRRSIRLRSCT